MRGAFRSLQLEIWYDKCIEERTSDRPPNPLDATYTSDISVMFLLGQKIYLKIGNNLTTACSFRFLHLPYHRRTDLRLSFVLLVRRPSDDALPVERKLLVKGKRAEGATENRVKERDRVLTCTGIIIIWITATSVTALLPPVPPSFEP